MSKTHDMEAVQGLVARQEIYDAICRYARAVDRGDWELLRSAYHPDAVDHHGDFEGGVEGLVEWLRERFAGVDNSTHFLGNCLVELVAPDIAVVETYFTSHRLLPPSDDELPGLASGDAMCRQVWGRYLDRFERRNGQWRVSRRQVVIDSRYVSVARGGMRSEGPPWGLRNRSDRLYALQDELARR